MLRWLAHAALWSSFVFGATHTVWGVEFVVSDKSGSSSKVQAKVPARGEGPEMRIRTPNASSPAYRDPGSILDELPDEALPPAPKLTPTPGDVFQSPLEMEDIIPQKSLPNEGGATQLPSTRGQAGSAGRPTMADPSFDGNEWAESNDMMGSCSGGVGGCYDGNCCSDGCSSGYGGCADKTCGWYMDLWISQGFTYNPDDPANEFNTPVTFNDRANEYQMNQLYLALGREVDGSNGTWDLGGRVDLLFGTDYFFTTATGLETRSDGSPRWNPSRGPRSTGASLYGLAMPQLYAEVFAPVLGGVNFKVGHFYTTVGYESVMAPENFFYSHAYTMQYGEPFTHTGVLASFGVAPAVTGHFGVTRGWDNWEDNNSNWGYLMGFSWEPTDVASLAATVHHSREDDMGGQDRTVYSIVYTRQLNERLRYVFQHDFGMEANAEFDRNFGPDSAKWYGVNQYLFIDINSRLTTGFRFEWFRDQDNARVLGIPFESLIDGGNYVQVTHGWNWKATDHMTFRPELRYDWSDVNQVGLAGDGMFNDFTSQNQFTLAMDMIFQF